MLYLDCNLVIILKRAFKLDKSVMIHLILVYCLLMENSFIVASNWEAKNFHLSFCDMKPNCDGDSELFDRIVQAESRKQDNDNHLYDYPVIRTKRAFAPYRTGKTVASKVSEILDNLLLHSDYDKRIRPQVYLMNFKHKSKIFK